jgi:histidine-containing phosphotransfer protein|uniref:Histidine-containing phosphotransfer protein n=1 Tax=Picea sitchensis TaxID=3332 RepID=A9NPP0_PICSI|nr:unknown [Picea sitchensis]
MAVSQMQQRYINFTTSLFQEGFVDEQFTQLQQLQDESNPDFVAEVVCLFFEDSEKLLGDLSKTLNQEPVDFKRVDGCVHQFKGSSSSIGARRVMNTCVTFRAFCQDKNREGCLYCLQQMKQECYLVKNKLETLFQLEKQIVEAGGTVPMAE